MPNFQKIIDILSNAFSVLDFSFMISGMSSFLIIVYDLYCHDIFFLMENIGLTIVCGVFLAYLCGLFSWIVGKRIRSVFFNKDKSFNKTYQEAMDFVNKYQLQNSQVLFDGDTVCKKKAYTYMWTGLEKIEAAKDKVSFIRRFWVMRAVFEGLIATCLLGVIALIDLKIYQGDELEWLTVGVLSVLLLVCAWLSAKEAKSCVENEITEVILSYYTYRGIIDVDPE